jgi:exopolysaccharide biosynthesis polyprenyl glycosylphosphotransferase
MQGEKTRRRSGSSAPSLDPGYVAPSVASTYAHPAPVGIATPPRSSDATNTLREPFPLVLQRHAPEAIKTHAWRSAVRVSTLLTSDALVLLTLRIVYRGLREHAWLGGHVSSVVYALVPNGTFPIIQSLCAVVLGLAVFGNYREGDRRRKPTTLLAGTALGLSLVFWPQLWGHGHWARWVGFPIVFGAIGGAVVAARFLVDVIVRRVRPPETHAARTLVIGSTEVVGQALQSHAMRRGTEYQIVGFLDLQLATSGDPHGAMGEVAALIEQERVDTILLAGVTCEKHFLQIINIADAAGCHVQVVPVEFLWRGRLDPQIIYRRGTPIIQLTRPALRGSQLFAKRCFDLVAAAALLALLSPILIAIGLAVRFTSRGPALFRQIRVGKGGRRFHIYKFRTMVTDADDHREQLAEQSMYSDMRLFKIDNDPRVTPIGALLRRTSVDELPQLLNVIRGDMSLVGPRPPMPAEVELYDEHHYTRFDMKPGITGPWQVGGRNRITDFEEVVRLESAYARGWSIAKDFRILLRTIPVVLRMDGAH